MSDIPKGFKKALRQARALINESEKLNQLLNDAYQKAKNYKQKIDSVWEETIELIELIKAYTKGEYRNISWKAIIYALAAVVYFVNPLDMIPDFIFGIGFLDDATIIAFVANAIREELKRFKESKSAEIQ
jgi:uncharacterized membrane protein YkvA (DUF1232 family)